MLIACRSALAGIAGPIHRQFLPSPTLAPKGQGQSRLDPLASSLSPTDPILRANPFPEVTDLFCRLPLPTLFCRPEAFSLGDRLRLTVRTGARERDLPWIFQAQPQDTLLHERSAAFQDSEPCPCLTHFKGQPILQKETTASSGACGHGLQDRHCVAASFPCIQVAECSRIPFRQTRREPEGLTIGFEASNYTLP